MGMTLCGVGRGLLEGLPLALFKGLGDLQEHSGEEEPCLVTHAGSVPLPVCVFTVLEPRATDQNPICKIRLTGLMPSMDSASVGKTPPLWMQVGSCSVVLCAALWCWLTKHKHGRTCPHILPGLSLLPYSSPAHSCSEPDRYQSTPGYSMRSKKE